MGRYSDDQVVAWLRMIEEVWVSIHHESPEASDPYTSEISGGSYGRVLVTMGDPVGRTLFNITRGKFSGLPAVRGTHLGIWDSQVNGMYRGYVDMEPTRFKLGDTFTIEVGDLALSID